MKVDLPIKLLEFQADVEQWAEKLLEAAGSGTVELVIEVNVKDRKWLGYRLGGSAARRRLTDGGGSVR